MHFKSFLIELLWAHLLDTKKVPGDDLGEALLGFFGYIVRTGPQEPISFTDYGQDTIQETMTGPVRVLDPVNAENNVAARIDASRREELVASCRQAFEALAAAQTAPTAAVARAYYRRVLGPAFDLPRDVPGEASDPTSKDHVKAREHDCIVRAVLSFLERPVVVRLKPVADHPQYLAQRQVEQNGS